MPTFDEIEESVEDATPAELYTAVAPLGTWRWTSYERDISISSLTYTAIAGSRSSLSVGGLGDDLGELVIEMPPSHELVQAYAGGIPADEIAVTVTRYHVETGVSLQLRSGYATSLVFRKRTAALHVSDLLERAMSRDVPSVLNRRLCNHVLYDDRCTVAESGSNVHASTISAISTNRREITVTGLGAALAAEAKYGRLRHVATSTRRAIVAISTDTVTLRAPLPAGVGIVGDSVVVSKGCDQLLETCSLRFDNAKNFGGNPYVLPSNVFYVGLRLGRF